MDNRNSKKISKKISLAENGDDFEQYYNKAISTSSKRMNKVQKKKISGLNEKANSSNQNNSEKWN